MGARDRVGSTWGKTGDVLGKMKDKAADRLSESDSGDRLKQKTQQVTDKTKESAAAAHAKAVDYFTPSSLQTARAALLEALAIIDAQQAQLEILEDRVKDLEQAHEV